jgi:hypothetical protein
MFEVADHHFSWMVAQKSTNVIVNNHIFLPNGGKVTENRSDMSDYRALWAHAFKSAGEYLLSVETPKTLITIIVYAILGDYQAYL